MLNRTYELDMVPGGIPLSIHLSQYDSDVTLKFQLYASQGVLDIPTSGVTAIIRGTKLDGNGISAAAAFAFEDSIPTVTVQMTKQMTAIAGRNKFEIVLTADLSGVSFDLPSANFYLDVERAALDYDTLESKSEIMEIQEILSNADNIIRALQVSEETQANMAALTTRAETAATNAETDANTASTAATTATTAADAATTAVNGFNNTVNSATSAAVQTVQDEGPSQVARVEAAGDGMETYAQGVVSDAKDDIDALKATALSDITSAKTVAITAVNDTKDSAMTTINSKAQEVSDIATSADAIAAQALQQAGSAMNEVAGVEETVSAVQQSYTQMELLLSGKVDGGYVENDSLYLTSGGEVVAGPFTGFGGGGGGGGGSTNTAVITMENTSGFVSKTIAAGGDCELSFYWTSIEDQLPTGNGSLTIRNNNIVQAVLEVAQGNITMNVGSYLSSGMNTVQLQVSDSYGNSRVKNFTITVVELSLTSSFDDSTIQTGVLVFPYTPYGAVSKTVHVFLDGVEQDTVTTSVSARQQTYLIPQQSHGAHTLRMYFEATVNGNVVRSNELYYEIIWYRISESTPIIASSYNATSITQFTTVNIPYTVFTPGSQMSDVVIRVGTRTVSEITVDRSKQMFSYRFNNAGEQTVLITSGVASKSITFTVTASSIDCHAETANLALFLSSASRSNNEANPAVWTFTPDGASSAIEATFSNFNFTSDGWTIDSNGITALRVSGDARLTIPYKPFAQDFRTTGKTIEIEFATRDVLNYDAVILSCLDQGRGISLTAQGCTLTSEQSSISMQFKEEEHVRVGFVVEKRSGFRRIYCYINGTMSGVVQYPDGDDFSQVSPANITVGNNLCTIDLYCIRVYDNDLSSQQMEENWIADTQDGALMLERYNHNNVRDEYGNIVISKLPNDLPYMIIECAELPQYKGDKKTCAGQYVDPLNPSKSFTFTGAQIDVQGTSSQYYERKNYKVKYKNGFVNASGNTVETYQLRDDSIPTDTFCFKADVASSEGANNVELARLYNDTCPYKTPAQVADERVRQGIDGFPIVIFWHDTTSGTTSFLGKANFNHDKSTEEVFGFAEGDESWEILNNTSDRVLWKSDDFTSTIVDEDGKTVPAWLSDFEARYPDTDPAYTDYAQLKEFASWVKSTDPEQATGNTLAEAVTFIDGETSTTYTEDTAAYRKAKFRAELGNYVELDSTLFFYIFTEIFLMVDNRAKNMFPSFLGSEITSSSEQES